MKKIICILFGLVVGITSINALEEEKILKSLDDIPVIIEDGVEYIDIPSIDPDILIENGMCDVDKEYIINGDPEYYNTLSQEELEKEVNISIEHYKEECKKQVYYAALLFYFREKGIDFHVQGYGVTIEDKNTAVFQDYDSELSLAKNKIVKLRYAEEYNENIRNEVKKIEEEIKRDYSINGMAMLNSLYHYGGIDANIYNNDLVLYRFDALKETIEKYDEYEIIPRLHGAGGTPILNGNAGFLGIFKDGIMYGIKETNFSMNHVIYVSEQSEGTLFEKAEKLIKEYFDFKVDVEVKSDEYEEIENDPFIDDELNKYLGKTEGTYKGILTTVNVEDKSSMLFIVEVPEQYLENTNIKSSHKETGINIKTDSYHVPIDVTLDVSNVKENDYVKKFVDNYKIDLEDAFDINLMKKTDGTFVKNIPDGVEVYIPVSDKEDNEKIKIIHIKEDSSLGEILEGEVITSNEKQYIKFITNHFSTYAYEDISNNEIIENPNTYDGVEFYFGILIISFITMLFGVKKIKE